MRTHLPLPTGRPHRLAVPVGPDPAGCSTAILSFWPHIGSAETTIFTKYDTLVVKLGAATVATYSNLNKASGYQLRSLPVGNLAGQTLTLSFTGTETGSQQTSFVVDDVSLNVSRPAVTGASRSAGGAGLPSSRAGITAATPLPRTATIGGQ